MSKRVIFNGIEILTEEGDASVYNLLGFVEDVIEELESSLDDHDQNFHLSVNMNFSPTHPPRHTFSLTNLSSRTTRRKVVNVLKRTADSDGVDVFGLVRVDLEVEDE